jgi:hypothetical protein
MSAVVATVLIGVVVIETDVLPSTVRTGLRVRLHTQVDEIARVPLISRILREFH